MYFKMDDILKLLNKMGMYKDHIFTFLEKDFRKNRICVKCHKSFSEVVEVCSNKGCPAAICFYCSKNQKFACPIHQ